MPLKLTSSELNVRRSIPSGCTVITISKAEMYSSAVTTIISIRPYYWVEPGDSSKYGVIWIGLPMILNRELTKKALHMIQTDFPGLR